MAEIKDDLFEVSEDMFILDESEIGEIEVIEFTPREDDIEEEPEEKAKPKITYKAVKGEKSIRRKYKDGIFQNYEVTVSHGRKEIFDKRKNIHRKKEIQTRKTFYNLDEAIRWRNEQQNEKLEAKQKGIEYKKQGITLIDAANAYYEEMEKRVQKKKKAESYLIQLRIQTDHFKRFFNGERTKYVKTIDVKQLEEYFEFEEENGASRASINKYKSHLNEIWKFMLKDKATYGVKENIVELAEITAPATEFKATALKDYEIAELITEACELEDPTFLYLVVFGMSLGLRRGEMAGLMWGDIDFDKKRIKICHNRVQLASKDILKLPKRDKVREVELHKLAYDAIWIYKIWQEEILGRAVKEDEFVLQWEINLLQSYVCDVGKVSRKWKEIYKKINKRREKEGKEPLRYARLHDGRHTYITLSLQGIKKPDGKIVAPASYFQVFQSAGHSLPNSMKNISTTIYNEDIGDRWDITRFWDEAITLNLPEIWYDAQKRRVEAFGGLEDEERKKIRARKEKRYEKAKKERENGKKLEYVVQEYEEA